MVAIMKERLDPLGFLFVDYCFVPGNQTAKSAKRLFEEALASTIKRYRGKVEFPARDRSYAMPANDSSSSNDISAKIEEAV